MRQTGTKVVVCATLLDKTGRDTHIDISIEMIAHSTILAIICSTTVTVYPEYGLVSESIKTDQLIITHGEKSIYTDLIFNFPQYNVEENDLCFAREILTKVDNFDFNGLVSKANEEFIEAIDDQFSSQLNKPTLHEELLSKPITTRDQLHTLMINLDLCQQKKLHCEMEAISISLQGPAAKGYTRYKNQPYPCTKDELLKTDECSKIRAGSVCCNLQNSKNELNCPQDALEPAIVGLQHYIRSSPQLKLLVDRRIAPFTDDDLVPINEIKQFCFMLTRVKNENNTIILYENHRNDPINDPPEFEKMFFNEAPQMRQRRLASRFVNQLKNTNGLGKILEQVDILNTPISELRQKLEHSDQKTIRIIGNVEEQRMLKSALCQFSGEFKQNDLKHDLNQAKIMLESKIERVTNECEQLPIPHLISNEVATRFCRVNADNSVCVEEQVRNLYKCELSGTEINASGITIRLKITLSVPIDDAFQGFKYHTIPKYVNTNIFTDQENVTSRVVEKSPIPESKSDLHQLKDILAKISKYRRRRNIVKLHHNIELSNMPDFGAQHENELILFQKENCKTYAKLYVCPFSKNDHHFNQCVKALLGGNSRTVEKICEFNIYTTESNCEQEKIEMGYIISTSEKITISPAKEGQTIFNTEVLGSCTKVCFVPNTKSGASFQCDQRNYFLENKDSHAEIVVKNTEPLDIYKLKDGQAGLSDTIKTDWDKFNKFLAAKNVNARDFNSLTILSAGIIGITGFMFGTKRAILAGKLIASFIEKSHIFARKRFASKNEGYAAYLKLKELQSKNSYCA